LGGSPKFGQNNCLTYNYLYCEFQLSMSSRLKWPFFRPTFWGNPFGVELNKTNMQTTPIGLHFYQLSKIYTLSGLGGVSGTSDWSEEKKNKIRNKVPQLG